MRKTRGAGTKGGRDAREGNRGGERLQFLVAEAKSSQETERKEDCIY